jgi:hypothetical protein
LNRQGHCPRHFKCRVFTNFTTLPKNLRLVSNRIILQKLKECQLHLLFTHSAVFSSSWQIPTSTKQILICFLHILWCGFYRIFFECLVVNAIRIHLKKVSCVKIYRDFFRPKMELKVDLRMRVFPHPL